MWSRRFEQGLVLTAPDRRSFDALEWLVAIAGLVMTVFAAVDHRVRILMAGWLVFGAAVQRRARKQRPSRAVWRPGRGWTLELPGRPAVTGRLRRSTRILPLYVALSWTLPDGRCSRLLVFRWQMPAVTFRRLRVLLRYGRGDG